MEFKDKKSLIRYLKAQYNKFTLVLGEMIRCLIEYLKTQYDKLFNKEAFMEFKDKKSLIRYLKAQKEKGIRFYSKDRQTNDILKKAGVAACYIGAGLAGAWFGSRFLGPKGSAIGATVGIIGVAMAHKRKVIIKLAYGHYRLMFVAI